MNLHYIDEIVSNPPGFKLSSECLFTGSKSESDCYSASSLIHPFTSEARNKCYRSPIICLSCGGYLNKYSEINLTSGEWECPLCRSVNPGFCHPNCLTERTLQEYIELYSKSIDYCETSNLPRVNLSLTYLNFVFAIDLSLCSDSCLQEVLKHALEVLPQDSRITILIYSEVLNILRLNPLRSPIVCDTLPGSNDCSRLLSHFIQQGIYSAPLDKCILDLPLICQSIRCLAPDQVEGDKQHTTINSTTSTATAIIGFAVALNTARFNNIVNSNVSTRLLLFTSKSLSLGHIPKECDGSPESLLKAYHQLGTLALTETCYIDIFCIGISPINIDQLDEIATATGGSLTISCSMDDQTLLANIITLLKIPKGVFPPKAVELLPILEIRVSPHLMIEGLLGPILTLTENYHMMTKKETIFVNDEHLSNTIQSGMTTNTLYGKWSFLSLGDLHDLHNGIQTYCQQDALAIACAISRCDPLASITANLRYNNDYYYSPKQHDYISKIPNNAAFIQCILRYRHIDYTTGEIYSITRVWTSKLRLVPTVSEYLESVDEVAWVVGFVKELVADLHETAFLTNSSNSSNNNSNNSSSNETRGIGLSSSTSDENSVLSPRWKAVAEIDRLVTEIASLWSTTTSTSSDNYNISAKARTVIRYLYHLREGPLLVGPAMDKQQSYYLRSIFLTAPLNLSVLLLQPTLSLCPTVTLSEDRLQQLNYSHENDISDELLDKIEALLVPVLPDWASLIPHCLALLDLGDMILIWIGQTVPEECKLCPLLQALANRRALTRRPCASLRLVRAGSSAERLVWSRLSPTTCVADRAVTCDNYDDSSVDVDGLNQTLIASLSYRHNPNNVSKDCLSYEQVLPVTDQPSFRRYLATTAPALMMNKRNMLRAPVSMPPMDRGIIPPPPPPLPTPIIITSNMAHNIMEAATSVEDI